MPWSRHCTENNVFQIFLCINAKILVIHKLQIIKDIKLYNFTSYRLQYLNSGTCIEFVKYVWASISCYYQNANGAISNNPSNYQCNFVSVLRILEYIILIGAGYVYNSFIFSQLQMRNLYSWIIRYKVETLKKLIHFERLSHFKFLPFNWHVYRSTKYL